MKFNCSLQQALLVALFAVFLLSCSAPMGPASGAPGNFPATFIPPGGNQPPDTSQACATPDRLWPPNHKFRDIVIGCVTDPDGDPITITVTAITQDEPLNDLGDGNTSPDGIISPLQLRAERQGTGDGRVYRIDFIASDGQAETPGSVIVCTPHSVKSLCVDSRPPEYDSTRP